MDHMSPASANAPEEGEGLPGEDRLGPTIELYADFISPYSYLAWCQLPALAEKHRRRLIVKPVLFGGVLSALGTRGPAEVPARRAYLMKDLLRRAHAVGVPLALPPAHPFNPLLALRVAAQPMDEAERLRIVSALFDAVWRDGIGVESEEQVTRALAPLGVDVATLLHRANEVIAKTTVRANTHMLVNAGGFGVPTMFVDGEMFFGSDSLPQMDAFLEGADPLRGESAQRLLGAWKDLPATARRPGS
jgi:2-hydroxychromene-2-carboxylate isomerase